MTTCTFSTPDVASPECSTEVSTGTLVPSTLPRQFDTLPATGIETQVFLIVGLALILFGLTSGHLMRWKIRRDWERADAEARRRAFFDRWAEQNGLPPR